VFAQVANCGVGGVWAGVRLFPVQHEPFHPNFLFQTDIRESPNGERGRAGLHDYGQWIGLRRAADRAAEAEDYAECDRLFDEADAVKAQITTAKPRAIGLAAKVYLFLHMDFFGDRAHEGAAIAPGKLFEGEMHPAGDAAFA